MVAHALHVQDLAAQRQDCLDIAAAAVLRGPACGVALYDEELGHLGIAHRAVRELAGKRCAFEQALAARGLAGLAGGVARLRRLLRLLHDLAGGLGVLLKVVGKAVGHYLEHERAHERAAELGLGLALELRVRKLDGNDRGKAFAHVIAGKFVGILLQHVLLLRVIVDHAGERGAEALKVHAALGGVDVVRKAHDRLGIRGVPLQGDLDLAGAVDRSVRLALARQVDGALESVGDLAPFVQELHEVDDAALVAELINARHELALVLEHDLQVLVQKRRLLQAVAQRLVVEDRGLEDLVIRPERRRGAGALSSSHFLHLHRGLAAAELHLVDLAAALDLHDHLLGEGVYHRDAHAVETARNLIGGVVELTARVEDRHDDFQRGDLLHGVLVHGDTAAVVHNGNGVIGVHRHLDLGAEASHGLVDRVVDDLPYEMVQAAGTR